MIFKNHQTETAPDKETVSQQAARNKKSHEEFMGWLGEMTERMGSN